MRRPQQYDTKPLSTEQTVSALALQQPATKRGKLAPAVAASLGAREARATTLRGGAAGALAVRNGALVAPSVRAQLAHTKSISAYIDPVVRAAHDGVASHERHQQARRHCGVSALVGNGALCVATEVGQAKRATVCLVRVCLHESEGLRRRQRWVHRRHGKGARDEKGNEKQPAYNSSERFGVTEQADSCTCLRHSTMKRKDARLISGLFSDFFVCRFVKVGVGRPFVCVPRASEHVDGPAAVPTMNQPAFPVAQLADASSNLEPTVSTLCVSFMTCCTTGSSADGLVCAWARCHIAEARVAHVLTRTAPRRMAFNTWHV